MRTRRLWSASLASLGLVLWSAGAGWALERQLVGIVLGRSYKTVLAKYGNPDLMIPVTLPTAGSLLAAGGLGTESGYGLPGGYGAPGGGYGAPGGSSPYGPPGMGGPGMGGPGYGPPGMPGSGPGMMPGGGGGGYGPPLAGPGGPGGPPGMSGPGGPPVLPPGGGYGGGPGYGPPGGGGGYGGPGGYGGGDGTTTGGGVLAQGNAVQWVYLRPGGASLEFWINEDGRVAQIAATGRTGNAVTSKGVKLGSTYPQVLKAYGMAELHRYSTVPPDMARIMGLGQADRKKAGQRGGSKTGMAQFFGAAFQVANLVTDVIYTKSHHAAFTLVDGKVVRITIALAD